MPLAAAHNGFYVGQTLRLWDCWTVVVRRVCFKRVRRRLIHKADHVRWAVGPDKQWPESGARPDRQQLRRFRTRKYVPAPVHDGLL